MKKLLSTGLVAVSLLTGSLVFAKPPTNHNAIVGVWANTNAATGSIVRFVIRKSGSGITVQPFGACSPTPCNHGIIGARAYAAGVGSAVSIGFNAAKSFGFKATSYNGFLRNQLMTLLTQDQFAAGDSRYNYTVMETFRKVSNLTEEFDNMSSDSLEFSDHVSKSDLLE